MSTNNPITSKDITIAIQGTPSGTNYYADSPAGMFDTFKYGTWLRPEMRIPDHVKLEDRTHYRAALAIAYPVLDFENSLQAINEDAGRLGMSELPRVS